MANSRRTVRSGFTSERLIAGDQLPDEKVQKLETKCQVTFKKQKHLKLNETVLVTGFKSYSKKY